MRAVAYVPRDDEPLPRAKRSPLALLRGGGLPPELELRNGALELLLRAPWPARDLITETCRKIPEFFGRGTRFALEDVVDAGEHLLYLVIGAELSADDAGRALDRFLEEWWLDKVEQGQESIHIGLELL